MGDGAIAPARYFTAANPPACSCPDFWYRGRERPCKHVHALRAVYGIIKANRTKWEEAELQGETTRCIGT